MKNLLDLLVKNNFYVRFHKNNNLSNPTSNLKLLRKRYIEQFNDKKIIKNYALKANKLSYFFMAGTGEDIGKKIIWCNFEKDPNWNKQQTRLLLKKTGEINKKIKTLHIGASYDSFLCKQLKNLGGKWIGTQLFGTVEDGYNYLNQYEYDDALQIKILKEAQLDEVILLEFRAHRKSKTSRCKSLTKESIRDFYKMCLEHKRIRTILVIENDKIIGTIVISINDFKVGQIMAISTKHTEQNRGIAKLLYFEALKYWKKKGAKMYVGFSTTKEVLILAKRMKRIPQMKVYEFKNNFL